MQLFVNSNVNFVGTRKYAYIFSGLLILAGLVSLVIHGGPKYGIDFTGGTLLQVYLEPPVPVNDIRQALSSLDVGGIEVTSFGGAEGQTEVLIRVQEKSEGGEAAETIKNTLKEKFPQNTTSEEWIVREEKVGPKVGAELKSKAIWAVLWSLVVIIIYIWFRFQLVYGFAAVVALFHDVLITLGIFSILGREISIPVIAAMLTIVGYSLNDTIVVFDRIRESLSKLKRMKFEQMVNTAINETLSRTIITALTTLITVVLLFILGQAVIIDFALALLIGITIGTYSSIYVASPVLLEFQKFQAKKQ